MPKPTVIAIVLTGEDVVAAAYDDPMAFIEERRGALDEAATQQSIRSRRHPVSRGSEWGLLLPDDRDITAVRTTYGQEAADLLAATIQTAPPESLIAWKVFETIVRGEG